MQVHLTLDVKLYIVYLYRSVREVKVKMASGVEPDAFFCYNNRDSLYTNENMALVFVPISIGMVEDVGLLKGQLAGFLIVVCISLVMTFLGTYASVRIVQICMKRLAGKGGQADE